MKVELISITPNCELIIEEAGRTCYKSKTGNPEIIKNWIKAGHESVIEHASATFRVSEVSRALTHQLVRHRVASYSQQSQRYVSEEEFGYVIPESIKKCEIEEVLNVYKDIMSTIQKAYKTFVEAGIPKEDSRFILPNACHTEIVLTMNFRELRHFLKLRMDKHAQWEIRQLANYILSILKHHAPNVFYDMENEI